MKMNTKQRRASGKYKQRSGARKLLQDPQFLFRAGEKLDEMGITGEKKNGLALLLAVMTKDFANPVSILLKGPTSSGKNNVVRGVVSFVPPECLIVRASLTPKALAYGSEDLGGKVFYIFEYRGGRDAQYLTRELQSEGSVAHEHTIIAGNKRRTKVARRVGDPVFLSTTTEVRVFADDETRFLSLRTDESEELTREVLRRKLHETASRSVQPPIEVWREALRLIAAEARGFKYPDWFGYLAEAIPAAETRARRDVVRFLSLLMAVAACTSFSDGRRGEKGDIEISVSDYCVAYEILNEAFSFTYSGAHPNAIQVSAAVQHLHTNHKRAITLKEIAEHEGWDYKVAQKWVSAALGKKLIRREAGTLEKNVKRFLPAENVQANFLPHPRLVLNQSQTAPAFVRYLDPLTGRRETLRRTTADGEEG